MKLLRKPSTGIKFIDLQATPQKKNVNLKSSTKWIFTLRQEAEEERSTREDEALTNAWSPSICKANTRTCEHGHTWEALRSPTCTLVIPDIFCKSLPFRAWGLQLLLTILLAPCRDPEGKTNMRTLGLIISRKSHCKEVTYHAVLPAPHLVCVKRQLLYSQHACQVPDGMLPSATGVQ